MKRFGPARKWFLLWIAVIGLCTAELRAQEATGQNQPSATQPASAADSGKEAKVPLIGDREKAAAFADAYARAGATGRVSEDFTTLKIPADLKVADPPPPMQMKFPEFTRELVQLEWRPADIINLYVLKPAGVKNPPVVLYLYSYPKDAANGLKDNDFGKSLTSNGCAAVGFVSALTANRFHDRPMKEYFIPDMQEALASTVHDVQLILNYLEKRGDFDMTRVGMYGDGSGATIAILAASVDPRIKVLDLLNPWGDWPNWMAKSTMIPQEDERADYLKPEFLKKLENLDPVEYLPKLTTQQIRLQYLDLDSVTPKAARDRIRAAAPRNAQNIEYVNLKALADKIRSPQQLMEWVQKETASLGAKQGSQTAEKPVSATPQPSSSAQATHLPK